jgi:putative membrane protein
MVGMMGPYGGGYDGYGMMGYGYGYPFFGWGMWLLWFIVFGIIGYFVYLDANKRGMNGALWWILVIIPMLGILFLIIYLIIRETSGKSALSVEKSAMDIVRERYAKGEISSEQFQKMSEDLKKQ